MTDTLDATGLTLDSLATIVNNITVGMQSIYGADINVDSNSPDGQLINLMAQIKIDLQDLINGIYSQFDVNEALGVQLDSLVALNNIKRKGATFTFQNIELTTDRALNLQGLDASANDIDGVGFTVADNIGNQFILLDSQVIAAAGTYTYSFRAKVIGAVTTVANTITNPITIVLGVTGINNPSAASSVGAQGELDSALRIRQAQSTSLGAANNINGLLGAVQNLEGVSSAALYENKTNVTDADGIPSHSIWLIAEGGADLDIADEIAGRLTAGSGMKGATTYDLTLASGQIFTAKFDRPSSENLYIRFNIKPLKVGQTFDQAAIKSYIVSNLIFAISAFADATDISLTAIAALTATVGAGAGIPINLEISADNITWAYYLDVAVKNNKWVLDTSRIAITIL